MKYGVLLYNERENEIYIVEKDISSKEEAEEFCRELRRHKLPAFIFKHKGKIEKVSFSPR